VPVHVRAQPSDIHPTVLLVGDPARATRVAESLSDARRYNDFRGLLGYSGSYRGAAISVQTTGMGCPSAAIVCEELIALGARALIRLGTCGALQPGMKAGDLVIATAACPLDGTTLHYLNGDRYAPAATFRLVRGLADAAERASAAHHVGLIATEDALYAVDAGWTERWRARGVLAQEMEASVIFTLASLHALEAACVLVASNAAGEHERLADDRLAPAVDTMISVALEAVAGLTQGGVR
jgi:purine-nucleoside phosphorylase